MQSRRIIVFAAAAAAVTALLGWFRQSSPPQILPPSAPLAGPAVRVPVHETIRPELIARLSPETSRFREWAAAFSGDRESLAEGKQLAAKHRARIAALVRSDPRRALDEALPVVLRQRLPAEIQDLLEKRVNARGTYAVLGSTEGGIRRHFTAQDGRQYEAYVFGRRVRQATAEDIPVHGVAVDGALAVSDQPLRPMEPGERVRDGARVIETCVVSGLQTQAPAAAVTSETPAVEMGGEVLVLCSGGHIRVLADRAIAAEGGTGGPSKPTGTVPGGWTSGVKSLLYMRLAFPDSRTEPQTEREAYDMMRVVNDFFVENSHGKFHLMTTVTPLILMPKPEDYYKANDNSNADLILSDARTAARAAGYDYSAYDLDAVRYNGASGSFSGQAYIGGRGCWLKSSSAGVAAHEFGHNLGLWHANYWNTGGESATGSGTNSEYGNSFDTMGSANAGNNWFNAGHQRQLQWIPEENVTRITAGGIYRLTQFDQPRLDPAARYLLSIAKDSERDYWCELRQRWTTNRWLTSGAALNWSPWGDGSSDTTAYGSNGGSQLIDTTPGSPDGKDDSAIVLGRTFSDAGAGIHITPLAKIPGTPAVMDVAVHTGTFPGNHPPAIALSASAEAASVNTPVAFDAAATDEDGDALAYHWDWGDRTFGPAESAPSHSWSSPGVYTVRCEVSDMRGGTRSAHLVVTIGSPAEFTVKGRVLSPGGDPVGGARIHNGLTGTSYRGTYSDSDGFYTLSGLAAGSYSLAAASPAHTFTGALVNPVTISDHISGADWTATPRPMIAMSVPDDSAAEGGGTALLRFTRVGGSITSALTIRVFTGGTASLSDADFTPAEVYDTGTWTWTIPAGQASLDVAVTAFNDTTAEGPETLTFYLVDGSGYLPAGPEIVSLTLSDNDTALPAVALTAPDNSATEGGDGATLQITRTGSTASPLAVSWVASGTAASGSDYAALPSTAVIPAGFSSVDVPLSTLQDALPEGTETATLTLSSSSAYIRQPTATSASVSLLDDDIPAVSITAPDAAASETGSDPAIFLITRTGDLTLPLAVDYALSGTAQHGTDYLPMPGSITIPAGLAHAALTVVPLDDAIGEPSQTVTVQIRSTSRYLPATAFSASASIADNDAPMVSVNISDGKADEAGGSGKFKITAQGTGSGNVTVRYTLTGSATQGVDYPALSGTLTVPKNGYAELTIIPTADAEIENAEHVVLSLLPDPAYTLSLETSATLSIVDGGLPVVNVSAAAVSYAENSGPARFYISRVTATADALPVNYTMAGTATAGSDFAAPSGTATIPANAAGVFVDVTLLDDSLSEGAESLSLIPAPSTAYTLLSASAAIWLTDNETAGLPSMAFSSGASTAPENAGTISVPVTITPAPSSAVTLEYSLESGSAFRGADYTINTGTLVIDSGTTLVNIPVTLLDDAHLELSETLTLRLQRAAGGRLGTTTAHTLTITDNDAPPPPLLGFAASTSTAGEAVGIPPGAIVFLSAVQASPITVEWAVTPGTASAADVAATSGTLVFAPGETAKALPVQIVDDTAVESNESLTLSLSAPGSGALLAPQISHNLTIQDNDDTSVSITATDSTLSEQSNEPAVVTVSRVATSLSSELRVALNIGGTASGADVQPLPAEVIIPAGAASADLMIVPVDDPEFDPAETLTLSLATGPTYTVTGVPVSLVITDNETGVTAAASDASAAEPNDPGSFTITRTGPSDSALTVNLSLSGTATSTDDYVALPAQIEIPAGASSVSLSLIPVDDALPEAPETVTLTITPSAGYIVTGSSATVGLGDDDTNFSPQVSILSPAGGSVFMPAGPGLLLDGTISDDGRPAGSALTVLWEQLSGDGTAAFENPSAADSAVTFSAPGSYLLRLSATDGELSASQTVSVFVMSDGLSGTNVGVTNSSTALAGSGTTWRLTGAGSGVGTAANDGFYYAWRKMSGDFTITARVNSITPASLGASARCGVMLRSGLGANARHAFMSVTPTRTSFAYRLTDGAAGTTSNTNTSTPFPRFVRLRRTGNQFSASHSIDGLSWTTQGTAQTITMPDPIYAGLAATPASTSSGTLVTALFDSFAISRTGNVAPFVEAGPEQSTSFIAALTGVVTDDSSAGGTSGGGQPGGGPTVLWQRIAGPAPVTLPATATGQAVFSSPGHYRLRLSANDGSARTFDDLLATVTSPFFEWQADRFGAASGDLATSGPNADPDNDGFENLAEYALSSDPLTGDNTAQPFTSRTSGELRITWRQNNAAKDTVITPQWSTAAGDWVSSGLTTQPTGSGEGWTEFTAALDISTLSRAQLRLLVTLSQN